MMQMDCLYLVRKIIKNMENNQKYGNTDLDKNSTDSKQLI